MEHAGGSCTEDDAAEIHEKLSHQTFQTTPTSSVKLNLLEDKSIECNLENESSTNPIAYQSAMLVTFALWSGYASLMLFQVQSHTKTFHIYYITGNKNK